MSRLPHSINYILINLFSVKDRKKRGWIDRNDNDDDDEKKGFDMKCLMDWDWKIYVSFPARKE